ncbi:hypothetical protein BDY21DRAFT_352403 [Lineolata rhizophorae]|uniref:Uncharacterized protein n=1 Tax=Lineolata rhizophorae TaxID=578093 RepID=A0A6A6NS95_9PEZI|nr:hypothetical protein BDY21DRAFT_352403 [Lineolata rhizophorae]
MRAHAHAHQSRKFRPSPARRRLMPSIPLVEGCRADDASPRASPYESQPRYAPAGATRPGLQAPRPFSARRRGLVFGRLLARKRAWRTSPCPSCWELGSCNGCPAPAASLDPAC